MKSACIIIEDEPLAAERLKQYIAQLDSLNLVGVFENPLKALDQLNEGEVDLMFLDINLKEINGMDFLASLKYNGKVIVTTAYDQYALQGYELEVVDYLLKPFTFDRFLKAVTKFQQHAQRKKAAEFVFIKTENRLEKISLEDIIYIKGMGDYRQIVCTDKKIMTLNTFGELEGILPPSKIVRVHKSYMVSLEAVQSIKNDCIQLKDKIIPISDTYKSSLYQLIGK